MYIWLSTTKNIRAKHNQNEQAIMLAYNNLSISFAQRKEENLKPTHTHLTTQKGYFTYSFVLLTFGFELYFGGLCGCLLTYTYVCVFVCV